MKLQKLLQAIGYGSRRELRKYILDGEFFINGNAITDPNFEVNQNNDVIKRDGKRINIRFEKRSYYIFNKPLGVITSLHDPQGRVTVKDYIGKIKERVYPVGRLDYNSEGLILLTNDGELTNFIISAKNKIPKTYLIKIKGVLDTSKKYKLEKKGIFLEGKRVHIKKIDYVRKTVKNNSWLRISIIEGKKHIVRKIFKFSGHPVEKLKRTAIGSIKLGKLPSGMWKELPVDELEKFKSEYNYNAISSKNSKINQYSDKNITKTKLRKK